MAFVLLLDPLPALGAKIDSVYRGGKRCVGDFPRLLVSVLLVLLSMTAAGDTQAAEPIVGKQASQPAATGVNPAFEKAHQVCLACHNMSEESINLQPRQTQKKHRKTMEEKGLCTECHTKATIICCHDNIF